MRNPLVAVLVIALSSSAAIAAVPPAPEKPAAIEWRVADGRDVPAAVKQALIAECEKQAGEEEVSGFTYYQTPFDAKEQRFKAEFRAGAKRWTILCKTDGTIESSKSAADQSAPTAPKPSPTPGPKAPAP